jgi:hypothetical protein
MTVNINSDDVKLFEENGFTKEQVGATVNHYREQGLSDDAIQAKMNDRLNQFRGQEPTLPLVQMDENGNNTVLQGGVSKNIDLTPSGIADGVALNTLSALGAPLYALKNKQSLPQAFQDVKNQYVESRNDIEEQYPNLKRDRERTNAQFDFGTYMLLPGPKGTGIGKQMLNSALQGGIIAGAESTKNNGLGVQNLKDAALGAGIGAALPPMFKAGGAVVKGGVDLAKKAGKGFAERIAHLKPSTIERAVQPDSVALDLNEDAAQNLLMNTTEDIQRGYKNLLDKAGQNIQYAAMRLPENRGVWASTLKDSLDDIYAGYSTGTNKALNPAYNNAGDIYSDINSLIEAGAVDGRISAPNLNDIMNNIKNYPIEWNKTTSKDRQQILKQIYNDYSRRLGNLSPELRKANKAYSELAKFDDNEGVRQIINPNVIKGENIDSASRALKNYNSTVTKGNTNRNIQDLEKILVKNGNEPFIGKIDDVNAAMNMLTGPATGVNFLGARDLAAMALRPVLRGIRATNKIKANLPASTVANINALREGVPQGLYKLLIQGVGRSAGSKK